MMPQIRSRAVTAFGDFQTPPELAKRSLYIIKQTGLSPRAIIEPSCGSGAFLAASQEVFPDVELVGLDINPVHLDHARQRLSGKKSGKLTLICDSFFQNDWKALLDTLEAPLLITGNPPWVTNAQLGWLGSDNLPEKSNFQNMKGLDALTGKANFDISEWMLLQTVEWLRAKGGALGVLCKTAVARKVLLSLWKKGTSATDARIYRINALSYFGAAVDACLFILQIDGRRGATECAVYADLDSDAPGSHVGFADGALVSNAAMYQRHSHLAGINPAYAWRSGVKHDCSKVLELDFAKGKYVNGLGEMVQVEETVLYPLMKSSDVAGSVRSEREKYLIVTQRHLGEDTRFLKQTAPLAWAYLQAHCDALRSRTSVIYRNKPDFSIFGIGDYSFAPWKIAISGLYKKLAFRIYGPKGERPTMFDDTVYFLPFASEDEAKNVLELLNTNSAQEFLESLVFWDAKRPITVDLLRRLDIAKLAASLDRGKDISNSKYVATDSNLARQFSLAL